MPSGSEMPNSEELKVISLSSAKEPAPLYLDIEGASLTCITVIGKIKSTDVALKGQTVSSSYKPAVLDNGLNIQVPPFIEADDEVIVDTRNLEYVKKI